MNRTFYIEEKDREVINEFVEIHKAKAAERKAKGESIRGTSYSNTLEAFIKAYVESNKK